MICCCKFQYSGLTHSSPLLLNVTIFAKQLLVTVSSLWYADDRTSSCFLKLWCAVGSRLQLVSGLCLLRYIMKPPEVKDLPINFEVNRSKVKRYWVIVNGFWIITSYIFHLKIHTLVSQESRICPIDFLIKQSRSRNYGYWKWSPDYYIWGWIMLSNHFKYSFAKSKVNYNTYIGFNTELHLPNHFYEKTSELHKDTLR